MGAILGSYHVNDKCIAACAHDLQNIYCIQPTEHQVVTTENTYTDNHKHVTNFIYFIF